MKKQSGNGKRAVKDLTAKRAASVKGGLTCATGKHYIKAL